MLKQLLLWCMYIKVFYFYQLNNYSFIYFKNFDQGGGGGIVKIMNILYMEMGMVILIFNIKDVLILQNYDYCV